MIRLRIPVMLSIAAVAALAGHSAPTTAAGAKTIKVEDDFFSPKTATISKNTLVTWRWGSDAGEHDVTSRGTKKFKSSEIKSGGTYKVRFKKAGTFKYLCSIHEDEGMSGKIIVR